MLLRLVRQRYRVALVGFVFGAAFVVACGKTSGDREASGQNLWRDFSGEKAFAHVEKLVGFGPRPPASDAIEKSRAYIIEQLKNSGWEVSRQEFTDDTPRGKIRFVNLIARFRPAQTETSSPSFLLCSHYDTKTFDTTRFVGANDGGSSTGLLIELGRVLAERPTLARKIELVFFDGEEAYEAFTDTDGLYGSRYFAKQLVAEHRVQQYQAGILFDMIGDKSLNITLPPDSPPKMAREIFAAADALKVRQHFTYFESGITDDHTPLNTAGVPVMDLIDFDFPPWHTAGDTLDKISAESLGIVGSVALRYLSETALK